MKGSAIVAMIGVFIDPFVVLTVTALVVISTLYAGNGVPAGGAAEGVVGAQRLHLIPILRLFCRPNDYLLVILHFFIDKLFAICYNFNITLYSKGTNEHEQFV